MYGLEACPLKKSDIRSLDFVVDRFFMKLFNTNNIPGAPIKNNPLEKILYLRNCSRFFHQIYAVSEEDLGHVSSKLHLDIWFDSKIITIWT